MVVAPLILVLPRQIDLEDSQGNTEKPCLAPAPPKNPTKQKPPNAGCGGSHL